MPRVVYLHVGAPKTGTTYLQERLYLNRANLLEHDVSYPVGNRDSMFAPALDLIDLSWGGQRESVRGQWGQLMGRVRRGPGQVILSHEILAGARTNQIRRAFEDLSDAEVHLIYSARDIARQIPAEWQEGIKHRRNRGFTRFVRTVQNAERRRSKMWFWRVQGLPDVLDRWSQGLPPGRVHLVTVPPVGAPRGELWRRYCRAFRLDPSWLPAEGARENVSLGTAESTLIRRLNRRLAETDLDADAYRILVRQLIVHDTLAARENMTRVTLPPDLYDWADEISDEWIEWVEGSGIDVIGDLSDLRPVRPPAGEPWADPDRPRERKVADAALDALVALVQEAAEHAVPDDAMSARLGRAARRLRGQ